MSTMYYTTRQTTQSGTVTETKSVTGRDLEEAILKAKIKVYRIMETFMAEKTMVSAYVCVTDLENGMIYISEKWEAEQTVSAE